jgi:hypothetical protein
MNAPIPPHLICLRRARPLASVLPPLADVPLLEAPDEATQAAEDAAFAEAFVRAETGGDPYGRRDRDD